MQETQLQETKMQESLNDFQCIYQHNQPATTILLDPKLKRNERFLCFECYSNLIGSENIAIIGMQKVIEDKIKKKMQMTNEIVDYYIQVIQYYIQNLESLKTKLVSAIEQILNTTQNWIGELNSKKDESCVYSFLEESENYIQNKRSYPQTFSFDFIDKINSSQFTKLKQGIKNLIEAHKIHQFNEFFQQIQDFKQKRKQVEKSEQLEKLEQQKQLEKEKWTLSKDGNVKLKQLNNSIYQEKFCHALVFNSSGTILLSTNEQDILVWNFDQGNLKSTQTLSLNSFVNCLVFSKKQDCFVSGSKEIICWKLIQNEWKRQQQYKSSDILCLVLNLREDELISGNKDKTINIFAVDFSFDKLQYLQSLNIHTSWVNTISLNPSGNLLVSSGFDHKIILWSRDKDSKWNFMSQINTPNSDDGSKVLFLKEDQFIWFTANEKQHYASIFQQKQKEMILIDKIEFKKNINMRDQLYQSIIYNPERNIMFIRYKSSIYILRKQDNCKFKITCDLHFSTNFIQGTLSNNGQYLVVYDNSLKQYNSYELMDV